VAIWNSVEQHRPEKHNLSTGFAIYFADSFTLADLIAKKKLAFAVLVLAILATNDAHIRFRDQYAIYFSGMEMQDDIVKRVKL
jgi:hypothetical protein